ncbi:hypothetical protein [Halomontanus rarus]|uniref:hypothetical protein n=1 Tax=Halomontanus rarus TaxID=3034020 RepID=UPI0023E7D805|nr:hypothetical protein [Halovivax sp. TS33]
MGARCKLCQRQIDRAGHQVRCECGWVMDEWCDENHHSWCPKHGDDRWVGAVEL